MQKVYIITEEIEKILRIKNTPIDKYLNEYINKFPRKEFPGNHPTRVLYNNILETYNFFSIEAENILSDESYKLDHAILYTIDEFITPKMHYRKTGMHQTEISERFCSYLWCVIFVLFMHYEYVAQHNPESKFDPFFKISETMLDRSLVTLKQGLRFTEEVLDWDFVNLPSPFPSPNLIEAEADYCLKSNHIYNYALTCILYHEVGHAVTFPEYDTKASSTEKIQSEKDADNFSLGLMLKGLDKRNAFGIAFGIIVTYFSILFLTPPNNLKSSTHPDTDTRIFYILESLKYKCQEIDDELKGDKIYNFAEFLSVYSFQIYFQLYNIDSNVRGTQHRDFDTQEIALEYFFSTLESLKE